MIKMLLLVAAVAAESPVLQSPGPNSVPVSIQYVNCMTSTGTLQGELDIHDDVKKIDLAPVMFSIDGSSLSEVVNVRLRPGSYEAFIKEPPNCTGDFHIDVIEGHSREICTIGHRGVELEDAGTSLYGTMPFKNAVVTLSYEGWNGKVEIPAQVDHGAFYFTSLILDRPATINVYGPIPNGITFTTRLPKYSTSLVGKRFDITERDVATFQNARYSAKPIIITMPPSTSTPTP